MTGIKTIYKSPSTVNIIWSWGYSSVGSAYLAPQLHSKFKVSLGYIRLVSNQKKKKSKQQHNRVKELKELGLRALAVLPRTRVWLPAPTLGS